MRLALRSLSVLLCLPTLACASPEPGASETDTGLPASTGATTTEAATTSTTASPTTTEGDPSAGASTGTSAGTTGDPTTSAATGDLTTGDATSDATTGDPGTGDATTGAAEELPPIESVDALELWLAGGAYKQWAAESQVHASSGPHGGNVRTYVNAIALGSLAAQQTEHPQDAATVKELYGDGVDTVIGYAVTRKTAAQSEGGATWYWYERVNATVYGGDLDVPLCTGCHGAGADFILTPYPLQ
jgi:hypothetical protein